MGTRLVKLAEIPEALNLEITKPLVNYSVALGRFRGDDPSSFSPLGSGTLVKRGEKFGILTAHHCLDGAEPEVQLGPKGLDTLTLLLTRGRSVLVRPFEACEHPLAVPESNAYGPDLTLIEIPKGPRLDSIAAISSFWNLDKQKHQMAKDLCKGRPIIVNAGYPELDYETAVRGKNIHHGVTHMGFIGALADGDVFQKSGWDYIESHPNRETSPTLPETFKGLSGGGIWAVELHASSEEVWNVQAFCLVGMTFYQTDEVNKRRDLRGHFIESIYTTAWPAVS